MTNTHPGAYTPFSAEIDAEAAAAFEQAMAGLLGVDYQPVAVAHQVVAGINFAFFCNATTVYPGASPYPAMVHIYRNLEGQAAITNIQKLPY